MMMVVRPRDGVVERLLHEPFGNGVEMRRGFIEDEDAWVAQQRAGDGDALSLSA